MAKQLGRGKKTDHMLMGKRFERVCPACPYKERRSVRNWLVPYSPWSFQLGMGRNIHSHTRLAISNYYQG